VAVRVGMNDGDLCGGFGVRWRDFELDYALSSKELGYSHRVAIRWFFTPFRLSIRIAPKVFSPLTNFTTITMHTNLPHRVKGWFLEIIESERGDVVKFYKGEEFPADGVKWDGVGELGKPLSEGVYRCVLSVVDKSGEVIKCAEEKVRIVTRVPHVEIPVKIGE
jgi:hypothetical protein